MIFIGDINTRQLHIARHAGVIFKHGANQVAIPKPIATRFSIGRRMDSHETATRLNVALHG